jgi:small subunit ribosomal protein S8
MSMTDVVSDFLTRIRNAQRAKIATVDVPKSSFIRSILLVLEKEGFISGFEEVVLRQNISQYRVLLKYVACAPVIKHIKRISRPGCRKYVSASSLPKVFNGLGIAVISTSVGVLTDHEARKRNVGGEVLCEIF